ncbi:MFS transporter [Steroidobacter agaridevorans]|uniref:MFS transporter n=2 Tax=Steroidobacter agaridevorans TaxID=2695856 RepID=A0A829YA74_9GAMM|nr:MFS transporter [Steroidobacter agaridevorans]
MLMSEAVESMQAVRSEATAYPPRSVGWYAVFVLALLYLVSILDRFIITLLVDPIKRDLGISDVQFGMLHGLAFALTFSLFGLILGTLADRFSRRWVIFAGVAVWSLATAACGLAQRFWHMLVARVGVGVGEAALNPCATSMITDLFPRERLTTAMAIYGLGATLGSGCAYFFGGVIVDLVAHTETIVVPVLGTMRSWQAVFLIVGLPGLLLGFLIFTLPEPVRRGLRSAGQSLSWSKAYGDLLKFIGQRQRFFLCHYTAFAFASAVVAGCGTWYPAHMGRTFAWGPSQIGLALGVTLTTAGIASQVIGGRAIDAMFRRGVRDAQLRWYAGCMLVATPAGIVAMTSTNPWIFLACLCLFLTAVSSLPTCASTALNLVTPNELRGTGIAFFSGTAGLIGAAAGPMLIAVFAEMFFTGAEGRGIGFGMATLIAICCPLGAVFLALGFRAMREAVADAERWAN